MTPRLHMTQRTTRRPLRPPNPSKVSTQFDGLKRQSFKSSVESMSRCLLQDPVDFVVLYYPVLRYARLFLHYTRSLVYDAIYFEIT